ncbi:MAG: N-formylglutamate deformylase [Gammaproteobacteria bacterium]|nr:N-formylglutamate deformylase [Gammaproteobacteria bacterium]
METFRLHRGTTPLLISLPHDGSEIPESLAATMVASARTAPDTDWHVSRLYDFALAMGASMLVPRYSRYVVDLNRPPDDVSLYPGQNTTGLCPIVQFTGGPVYLPDQEPSPAEIAQRVETYWRPYHHALAAEIERLREQHGRALLWEGHSIRAHVPFLFDGRLPDLNLGTAAGASCLPETQQRIEAVLATQPRYSWVSNGRFKGGYITRHHGRPGEGVEAVQLELAQLNYMDEDSYAYDEARAVHVQALLQDLLEAALGSQ